MLVGGADAAAHAADEPGRLRIAHLSPDSPAVDVALTPASTGPVADPGTDVADALGYGDVGGYRDVPAGSYAVSVRASGTSPTAPPALSARVVVPPGGVRTLVLSGRFADLALAPLDDDLTAPAAGTARVRVLAAAAGAPVVDVAVEGGPVLGTGLGFPSASGYSNVPAGPVTLRLGAGAATTTAQAEFVAGTVVSLLVLDTPDGELAARPVVDATAPAVAPRGGVAAGGVPAVLPGRFPRLTSALASAAAFVTAENAVDVRAPVRVRAPAAGLDAVLTGSGLDASGALAVPADPTVAGWYAAGPAPGQPGPAVLAGHVDWAGRPAVFEGLHRLTVGDEIEVERADGTALRFVVDRVVQVPKNGFPTADVYGPVPGAELRLITCGGAFDDTRGSYRDNVVVLARLVG